MIGAEVQKAIFDALKANPAIADGRIYDSVPAERVFPYVTIGEDQVVDDSNSCGDGWEVFTDVHVWSRMPGFPEAKALTADVVSRIRAIADVNGFHLDSVELRDSRAQRDPDGLTSHIVSSFLFVLDEA